MTLYKCIALAGPRQSGKTSLLHQLTGLDKAGQQKVKFDDFSNICNFSHGTELNVASLHSTNVRLTFLDCPGHPELYYEGTSAMTACDLAVLVISAEAGQLTELQVSMHEVNERGIPYFIFINQRPGQKVTPELMKGLERVCKVNLFWLESDLDINHLSPDTRLDIETGSLTPVFIGDVDAPEGVTQLIETLSTLAPAAEDTAEALETLDRNCVIQVVKTWHHPEHGKLNLCRILSGELTPEMYFYDGQYKAECIQAIYQVEGDALIPRKTGHTGETLAIAGLNHGYVGITLSPETPNAQIEQAPPRPPVLGHSIKFTHGASSAQIETALNALKDEMPSLKIKQDQEEIELWGRGEIQLLVASKLLSERFGLSHQLQPKPPTYFEKINSSVSLNETDGASGLSLSIRLEPGGMEISPENKKADHMHSKIEEICRNALRAGQYGYPVVNANLIAQQVEMPVKIDDAQIEFFATYVTQKGMLLADVSLHEPILMLDIFTPKQFKDDLKNCIDYLKGEIHSQTERTGWIDWEVIQATLPQNNLADFVQTIGKVGNGYIDFMMGVWDEQAATLIKSKQQKTGPAYS